MGKIKCQRVHVHPCLLWNVYPFRIQAQEISLHLSHTFSVSQENLFPWPRDLYVVSRFIIQSSFRFLHLEISTEGYQVHRVLAWNTEMPGHLERLRSSALWWAPNEVHLTQESLSQSLIPLPMPYVLIFLAKVDWSRNWSEADYQSCFSGFLNETRAQIQYCQGWKLWNYNTWEGGLVSNKRELLIQNAGSWTLSQTCWIRIFGEAS